MLDNRKLEEPSYTIVYCSFLFIRLYLRPTSHWSDILFHNRTVLTHCVAKRRREMTLLLLGCTKLRTLVATLSRDFARPLATKDEAPSIYVSQQNSLRRFELRMRWILTSQGGEFILHLPISCLPF